jgi:hypothetical protein
MENYPLLYLPLTCQLPECNKSTGISAASSDHAGLAWTIEKWLWKSTDLIWSGQCFILGSDQWRGRKWNWIEMEEWLDDICKRIFCHHEIVKLKYSCKIFLHVLKELSRVQRIHSHWDGLYITKEIRTC